MATVIQSSNQKDFNNQCKEIIGESVINFKAGADYTYHNKVNAWTKGNIVITHDESFDSYSLEIFN